ncbi:PREDICTED: thiol-disulfide oxidoreductase LTO1 [Lupinus angustifolius]|nr:PREDICTED: thiol-disulfide oxidoreductase LTO1 [Lupinus angustifolius]
MATMSLLSFSLSFNRCSTPIPYQHQNPNLISILRSSPRLVSLKCSSYGSEPEPETEPETAILATSTGSDWTYKLAVGISGIGFFETSYLNFIKLTGSDAFCPVGGGSCTDILNSDYAVVFGVPLPLIGLAAYGFAATIGFQLATNKFSFGINKSNAQLLLLATTTSMAAASSYFLYILTTAFPSSSCTYCLLSVILSFTLFFITVKDLGLQETYKQLGLQLFISGLVILTLNTSYSSSKSASSSLAGIELPYYATEISASSTPFAQSLARHLHSIGARMYGAFWCSHCLEQKEMFGREAAKELDYVECFPEGYRTGTKMLKACIDAKIEGFPTWIINGQVLSGEQELLELAQVSGYSESDQPS